MAEREEYSKFIEDLDPELWQSMGFRSADEYYNYTQKLATKPQIKEEEKKIIEDVEEVVDKIVKTSTTKDGSKITFLKEIKPNTIVPKAAVIGSTSTKNTTGVITIDSSSISDNVVILENKNLEVVQKGEFELNKTYYRCSPTLGCQPYILSENDLIKLQQQFKETTLIPDKDSPKNNLSGKVNTRTYYNDIKGVKGNKITSQETIGLSLNQMGLYDTKRACESNCYSKPPVIDEGFPCYGCVGGNIISVTKKWGDEGSFKVEGSDKSFCGNIYYESQSIDMFLTPADLQSSLSPYSPCYSSSVSSTDPLTDCGPSNIILEFTVSGSLTDESFYGQIQLTLEELLDYAVVGTTGSPTLNKFLDDVLPIGAKTSISYNQITGNFNGNWSLFNSYNIIGTNGYGYASMAIKVVGGEMCGDSASDTFEAYELFQYNPTWPCFLDLGKGYNSYFYKGINGVQLQEYANSYCNGVITQTYIEPTTTSNTASKSIFNPTYSGSTTGWLGNINTNYSLFQLPSTLASASFRDPSSSANPTSLTHLAAYSPSGSEYARFTVGVDITTDVTIVSGSDFIGNDGGNSSYKLEGPIILTHNSTSSGSLRIQEGQSIRIKDGISFDIISGCINPNAVNYNPSATIDNGSCILSTEGCTDPNSLNYNPAANVDNGSCTYSGCTDPTAYNYDPNASVDNGTCQYVTIGNYTPPKAPKKQYVKSNSSPLIPKLTKETLVISQGLVYNGSYYLDPKHGTLYGNTPLVHPNNYDPNAILYLNTNNQRRYISDNVIISTNLPAAYKAPIGSENYHKCSNCIFNANNYCNKWKAPIRANFWCKSYKPLNQLIMGGDTYRDLYPDKPQYGFYTSGNEFLLPNNKYYIGSYNITKNGIYETADSNAITLMLKPSLLQGPNFHFTKINMNSIPTVNNAPSAPTMQPTIQPTTGGSTPPPSTSTPTNTSGGGTGTSYSY